MEKIPSDIMKYLSSYGPQVYDGDCGEVIGWGYSFRKHMDEKELTKELFSGKKML